MKSDCNISEKDSHVVILLYKCTSDSMLKYWKVLLGCHRLSVTDPKEGLLPKDAHPLGPKRLLFIQFLCKNFPINRPLVIEISPYVRYSTSSRVLG